MEEKRLYDLYALDEDIKYLEKSIKRSKEMFMEVGAYVYLSDCEIKAIEHLIEAYRKLEEKNRKLDEKFKYAVPDNIVEQNYIPKSKIKEKIEELEKDIEIYSNYEEDWAKIKVLQELLEEEK